MATSKVLYEVPTYVLNSNLNWDPNPTNKPVRVTGLFDNQSVSNPWVRDGLGYRHYVDGSDWTAFDSAFEPDPVYIDVQCHFGTWFGYRGPLIVHDNHYFDGENFFALPNGHTSELDLYGLGSTAISRVLPTNPLSDLPTAVGELISDGLPGAPGRMLRQFGVMDPRFLAGEYVNKEFGLEPFFADLRSFGESYSRAEELINEYASRAGKRIRRKYDFPIEDETYQIVYDNLGGTQCYLGGPVQQHIGDFLTTPYQGYPGVRTDTITRKRKAWFKGVFTYYLPGVGKSFSEQLLREEALMRHLYGGISADTAWELIPFSWAADWMTNAGDVIHNISAFARDGLVMPYGFIMEACNLHVVRSVAGAYFGRMFDPPSVFHLPPVVTSTFTTKYQRRRAATPFGFGLDVTGFTDRQKSILSAIALLKIWP